FYVDKVNGKFLGVCAGIADYTGWPVFNVRITYLLLSLFLLHILIPLYFLVAWLAPKKPRELYGMDSDEAEFWQGVRRSPRTSARDVRAKFRDLDRRMADVESYYTSNHSRLAREIDELK
ncbi:MAG: envelope stress response membrane protein PspC, partial [Alphaproteobacteria bacterium]|nr:envelope stress response membrane protein PspC [Alphaproteobacteria bacterium]